MAEVRLIPAATLLALLLGCAAPSGPSAGKGSVQMPAGFRSVPVTDLDQEWARPVRRLERGVRLLPGLHRELVSVQTKVFTDPTSRDVILLASAETDSGLDGRSRRAFLKRVVVEVFGAEAKPKFLHSRTIGGEVSHYAETTFETDGIVKLGCYAIGGDSDSVWFLGALWRPRGENPFEMDRHLRDIAGQLATSGR